MFEFWKNWLIEQESKKNFENKVYYKAIEQFTKLKQLYVDIGINDGIKEIEKYIHFPILSIFFAK